MTVRAIETAVRELLAAAQAEQKAKLDAGRVDTVFKVGDRVLLRSKELLYAANIGKLRPRWEGPFMVTPCRAPSPTRSRCRARCAAAQQSMSTGSSPFSPGPTNRPRQAPYLMLGRKAITKWSCSLDRRLFRRTRGGASPADAWRRVEVLDNCSDLVAEYDHRADSPRCASRRTPGRGSTSGGSSADPAHGMAAAPDELVSGKALIGRLVLFRWPDEGWVRGRVARVIPAYPGCRFLACGRLWPAVCSRRQSRCSMLPLKTPAGDGYYFSAFEELPLSGTALAVMGHPAAAGARARSRLMRPCTSAGSHDQQSKQCLQLNRKDSEREELQEFSIVLLGRPGSGGAAAATPRAA